MKASFFLFSVLAAIAAAKTTTDVVNNKPSPTVQDKNTKTIPRRANATHEADPKPTVLEERDPAATQHKANTSIEKREPDAVTERGAESTGEVGEQVE
ncbi:hypothetical protein SLS63_006409 [Diaporthe eres]|uniref:Uncharacterized protein n=1 Tax=Diaporthe eres TaxID=83184 RepID=A0ABR1P8D3_DIAER